MGLGSNRRVVCFPTQQPTASCRNHCGDFGYLCILHLSFPPPQATTHFIIFNWSVLIGFLASPGRNAAPQQLRNAYLQSQRSYEGTFYILGGEKKTGVDCSRLVRAGLIRASIEQGLLTLNPKPVRFGLSLWWHDCSAKALGVEYRGFTRQIIQSPGINLLENSEIEPGDIAVTTSGVHVLAYLGGNEWIEADPDLKKVVIIKVPSKGNPWFYEPVRILRWNELETD